MKGGIKWRQIAESYPCDTCGAGPGDPCTTLTGRETFLPHVDRTRQAADNSWVDPEEV